MMAGRCCWRALVGSWSVRRKQFTTVESMVRSSSNCSNMGLLRSAISTTTVGHRRQLATQSSNEDLELPQPTEKDINSIANDDRTFDELTVDNFSELIKSDEDRQLIEELLEQYEYQKYVTYRVPTTIIPKQMAQMMEFKRDGKHSQVLNFFNYMFKTEMAKINQRRVLEAKKVEKRRIRDEKFGDRDQEPPGVLFYPDNRPFYGPWHNTCLTWQTDQDMRYPYNLNRMRAAIEGPSLVFDFNFEAQMQKRDIINMGEQIAYAYGSNYRCPEPFDIHFCNYRTGTLTEEAVCTAFGGRIDLPDMFISVTDRDYTELFDRNRLVYLTPNAQTPLNQFNEEDVYVIGAIVDRSIRSNVTLAKAKQQRLRMARLPIDEHVVWGQSSKVLTLNQMVSILLEARLNGSNWKEAFFKHIPRRKLKSPEQIAKEEEIRLEKMRRKKKHMFKIQSVRKTGLSGYD